jgi:hypothetical protein
MQKTDLDRIIEGAGKRGTHVGDDVQWLKTNVLLLMDEVRSLREQVVALRRDVRSERAGWEQVAEVAADRK